LVLGGPRRRRCTRRHGFAPRVGGSGRRTGRGGTGPDPEAGDAGREPPAGFAARATAALRRRWPVTTVRRAAAALTAALVATRAAVVAAPRPASPRRDHERHDEEQHERGQHDDAQGEALPRRARVRGVALRVRARERARVDDGRTVPEAFADRVEVREAVVLTGLDVRALAELVPADEPERVGLGRERGGDLLV